MKEIDNLAEKIYWFGETEHEHLTQETKDLALYLLMRMVMKRSSNLKTRSYANGNSQRIHIDEKDFSSPALEFSYWNMSMMWSQRKDETQQL